MLETLRVNTLTGKTVVIMLEKVIFFEESDDGQSTFIHFTDGSSIQSMDNICDLQEMIKKIAHL